MKRDAYTKRLFFVAVFSQYRSSTRAMRKYGGDVERDKTAMEKRLLAALGLPAKEPGGTNSALAAESSPYLSAIRRPDTTSRWS